MPADEDRFLPWPDLAGHASTAVTETVYRHQLKPVITKGAETMNTIFTERAETKSA